LTKNTKPALKTKKNEKIIIDWIAKNMDEQSKSGFEFDILYFTILIAMIASIKFDVFF
jgi:hypothetical protein